MNQKVKIALDVEKGKAPKSELTDQEVAYYYYNYTVQAMEGLIKPEPEKQVNPALSREESPKGRGKTIMPMPKPKKNEKRSEYVSRFMSNDNMKKEYPKQDQRVAVAYNKWRKHKRKK